MPVLEVWLSDGELKQGYSTHANGAIVDENILSVAHRIRAGEKVFMHRFGLNYVLLQFVIENNLYPKE